MVKKFKLFVILLIIGVCNPLFQSHAQTLSYEREWATYFGDENVMIADNVVDNDGNIYFVGMINDGGSFPATAGSHQSTYGGGANDGFLVKMDPQGQIIWASYYGGDDSEAITGIDFDGNDHLYLIGRTNSTNNIASPSSYQPEKDGDVATFIAKFNTAGERIWATYYSAMTSSSNSDFGNIMSAGATIVSDAKGFIYFVTRTDKLDAATTGTFQTEIGQANNDLVSKFSADGERIWATYYGIHKSSIYSIALGDGDNVLYLGGDAYDCPPYGSFNTYFGTIGSHQPEPRNCRNIFVSKFSINGNRIWSTYYGNHSGGFMGKNAIVNFGESVYFSGMTHFSADITTPGSYQEAAPSGDRASYLVKFNADGERQWGTYIGLDRDMSTSYLPLYAQLDIDSEGKIYMLGSTRLQENISTSGAFQEEKALHTDTYLAIFSPEGLLRYGTYFGGDGSENGSGPLVHESSFYMFGQTGSTEGITTSDSYQPDYMQSTSSDLETNIFITKFTLESMGVEDYGAGKFTLYPNPNNGSFTISAEESTILALEVYNTLGQQIEASQTILNNKSVQIDGLRSGLYFVKIISDNARTGTINVLVK